MKVTAQFQVELTGQEQHLRSTYYFLLSQLLCSPPTKELISNVALLGDPETEANSPFSTALNKLSSVASRLDDFERLDDEFHDLFVGLGRGELLPYASWYITGMLMDKPLSLIRQDLKALGIERIQGNREPEDHVAALFDIMGILITSGDEYQFKAQQTFYDRHLRPWVRRFFKDLLNARKANFYQEVGKFGVEFINFESEYLAIPA